MSSSTNDTRPSGQETGILAVLGKINPLIFVLLALYILMLIMSDRFFSFFNQMNIMRQASVFLIIAIGQTFVIGSRGIDLSVGSAVGAVGCFMASLIAWGVPVPFALLLGVLMGMAIGLVNGLVITKLKVNPLIATLGMMVALRGATHYLMGDQVVTRLPAAVQYLGQGIVFGIPMPAIIAAMAAIVGYWLFFHTRFGRYTLAIGSNEGAVGLVGISVDWMKIKIYMFQGVCVAVAAAVLIGRLNGASPDLGLNYELHIIAGVVLGGTALYGGVGSIIGTVLGILTIGIVENAMVLIRADFHLQRVLIGALLIAAVAYQNYRRRKQGIGE
ncbi:ABC transporter permease [Pelagibacterium lentulum]|uniref:Ribose ABC transporter n=1 Tax=Pelagibacterium lentulum TaxID=2029865 RepID=A0A916RDZ7_9HYPH|nr:ABC transporter permease [Pelagibacterium lentulum]GGA48325.1 ribose ABC transporter [Pelagibacterium lentulum]